MLLRCQVTKSAGVAQQRLVVAVFLMMIALLGLLAWEGGGGRSGPVNPSRLGSSGNNQSAPQFRGIASEYEGNGERRPAPLPSTDSEEVFRVRVVDVGGRPVASAPVALLRPYEGGSLSVGMPVSPIVDTGEDGVAQIPVRYALPHDGDMSLWFEVLGVFSSGVRVSLRGHGELLDLRYELTLPAFGQVVVSSDAAGFYSDRPSHLDAMLRVQSEVELGQEALAFYLLRRVRLVRGVAEFQFVEAGIPLSAALVRGKDVYPEREFGGPRGAGETVFVELPTQSVSLTGVVSFPKGDPLEPTEVVVRSRARGAVQPQEILRLVVGGGAPMRCTSSSRALESGRVKDVDLQAYVGGELLRSVYFTPVVHEGADGIVVGLGEVELRCIDLLCSGRVVSASGGGIVGARVWYESVESSGGAWASILDTGSFPEANVFSDESGRFSLRAARTEHRYRVCVSATGFSQATLEFEYGEAVELRLASCVEIAGVVSTPVLLPDQFTIVFCDPSGVVRHEARAGVSGKLSTCASWVGPLTAHLLTPLGARSDALAEIDVAEGSVVDLGVLDVAEAFTVCKVRVLAQQGGAFRDVYVVDADAGDRVGSAHGGEEVTLIARSPLPRCRVFAAGFFPSEEFLPADGLVVSLQEKRIVGRDVYGFPIFEDD
jgi:hypothetical protein